MSQNFHTPIPVGSPANAVTFNSVYEQLDFGVGLQGGGSDAQVNYLLNYWLVTLNHITDILADRPDGIIIGAEILWPDGSTGIYSAITIDETWLEVTSWQMSHILSGRKIVFSGLTRDINGNIINPGSFTIQSI